jgi:ketosteroid isomerase-like protein
MSSVSICRPGTSAARAWLGVLVAAAVALCATAPGVRAQGLSVPSDQETLTQLEKNWNAALYQKDLAFIDSILAAEYVATYEDGTRGDKAKELEFVRDFDQQVDSAIQDEFSVKIFGDTAIVWFTLHLVGPKQGQRTELTLRYTDVWVLRGGKWLCVSSQSTRLTAAP